MSKDKIPLLVIAVCSGAVIFAVCASLRVLPEQTNKIFTEPLLTIHTDEGKSEHVYHMEDVSEVLIQILKEHGVSEVKK